MATQLTSPTKSSTETASSTEDGRLSLQNDLFLIGNDLITRLLGKDVTGVILENESDKEVSVQVVIGYDTDDTDDTDDSQYE